MSEGTRELGELIPSDLPAHAKPRPEIEALTDEELTDSVLNPDDGEKVKAYPGENRLRDGSGRIREMKKRGFPNDFTVPVVEPDPGPPIGWENKLD